MLQMVVVVIPWNYYRGLGIHPPKLLPVSKPGLV